MRRYRIPILTLMMAISSLLQAQVIKGELFFGGNACQLDGDECYGYKKFGVHAGAGALIPVANFMDIGLEVLFNQKGAYKRDSITYGSTFPHAYNLKLNYAEVPLMIYISDKDVISVGLGVSYGRLVGLNEYIDKRPADYEGVGIGIGDGYLHWRNDNGALPDISQVTDINELSEIVHTNYPEVTQISEVVANSNTYKPHDFNFCADLRFRLWEGFHAELRYQYSIRPIRYRMFYDDPNLVQPNQIRAQYNNSITFRLAWVFNERRSKDNKEAMKKQ